MEISSHKPGSTRRLVVRALFYRQGDGIIFTRAIVQLPGRPAMELPDLWMWTVPRGILAMASGYIAGYGGAVYTAIRYDGAIAAVGPAYPPYFFQYLAQSPCGLPSVKKLEPATTTSPAGAFLARHWRFASSSQFRCLAGPVNVWIAPAAGPFGIVRATFSERDGYSSAMVLTREITDAGERIIGPALPPNPRQLWRWFWEERDGVHSLCLPQLGLPVAPSYFVP